MNDAAPIRILLVDDDQDDFLLTSDYLNEIPHQQFAIEWASSYEAAFQVIVGCRHDVYFFDFLLGGKTGLDLLKAAVEANCQAPIILLTGKGDQRIDEEAMRLGAADYLVKGDLNAETLERSIRYALNQTNMLRVIRENERKFRTIFEQSPDIVFLTTPEGRFLELNFSASRILGHSMGELFAMHASSLWGDPLDKQLFETKLETQGSVKDWETTLLHKSGERCHMLVSADVQHNSQGQKYYQGVARDITKRRKTERDLLLAEKASATGRLVRTLAHEIRNPLTNINLSLEELEQGIQDESLAMYLQIVNRSSKRINDLLNELLHSFRPSEIVRVKQSVQKVVGDTLTLAYDRMRLKNIQFETDYEAGDCLMLELDAENFKIALLNLIINAIEAMKENVGVLKVGIYERKRQCVVTIDDNGVGISPENMNRLFEPYFTSKSDGMGLGLAATLNIIQSNGGQIEVESKVGEGTKFSILFDL